MVGRIDWSLFKAKCHILNYRGLVRLSHVKMQTRHYESVRSGACGVREHPTTSAEAEGTFMSYF
jgi:hypothetical protein